MQNESITETLIIGLTGGIGSGKTTVAKIIEELGYQVIYMDDIAKEEMNSNANLKQKLIAKFSEVVFAEGKLNKTFLADYIFNSGADNKAHQEEINRIVHPFAIERMMAEAEILVNKSEKMIFVESALLFETGLFAGYDYVISVFTPKEIAIERVMERNNLSREQVLARMALQMSPEEKTKYADFTIENKGSLAELRNTVEFIVGLVSSLPSKNFDEELEK